MRYFRADFSDPAFPCVRECDETAEGATTWAAAKGRVREAIRSHLGHWRDQLAMLNAEKKPGKPLIDIP